MSVPSDADLVGDRYRIERRIGQGAMGAVFAVRDERSNRRYALKWIDADAGLGTSEQIQAWVQREIKALQLLQHPAILQLFDHGTTEDGYWVITELLAGKDLLACVDDVGPLEGVACAAIGAQLCSALAAAHEQGIVHRDVKPGNLFLCDDGRFILLDFGVAKAAEGGRQDTMAKSANTVLAGTVSFLSPEIVGGAQAAPSSDQFAVGGTLQWLLTGALPFAGTTILEMLGAIAKHNRLPIDRPDVPRALLQEIDRLMEPDPMARPSAKTSAQAFAKIAGGESGIRAALTKLAQQKPEVTGGQTKIITSPRARLPMGEQTAIVTSPVFGGHTQIVTSPTAVEHTGQTRVVTSLQTSPSAHPDDDAPSRVTLIAAVLVLIAGVGAFFGIRAYRMRAAAARPVVAEKPVVVPDPSLPEPKVELPPPTAPEAVEKPVEPAVNDDRPGTASLSFEHWVELSLDGKSLGKKEFATKLTLAPGKHVLVAEHPKFGTRRFSLDVKPGRATNLHIDLSRSEKGP